MISDQVLVAIITGLPATLAALAGIIMSLRNGRKIDAVHETTNSKMQQLLDVSKSDAKQKGHTEGVADEKVRQSTDGAALPSVLKGKP